MTSGSRRRRLIVRPAVVGPAGAARPSPSPRSTPPSARSRTSPRWPRTAARPQVRAPRPQHRPGGGEVDDVHLGEAGEVDQRVRHVDAGRLGAATEPNGDVEVEVARIVQAIGRGRAAEGHDQRDPERVAERVERAGGSGCPKTVQRIGRRGHASTAAAAAGPTPRDEGSGGAWHAAGTGPAVAARRVGPPASGTAGRVASVRGHPCRLRVPIARGVGSGARSSSHRPAGGSRPPSRWTDCWSRSSVRSVRP
jgi:hypothetical protein